MFYGPQQVVEISDSKPACYIPPKLKQFFFFKTRPISKRQVEKFNIRCRIQFRMKFLPLPNKAGIIFVENGGKRISKVKHFVISIENQVCLRFLQKQTNWTSQEEFETFLYPNHQRIVHRFDSIPTKTTRGKMREIVQQVLLVL